MTAPARVSPDFAAIMRPVAEALLGEPNARLSTARELRFGNHGSLAVHVAGERAGTWRDFEGNAGGGVLALVMRERGGSEREALAWLRDAGFIGESGEKRRANGNDFRAPASSRRTGSAPNSKPRDTTGAARRVWDATRPLAGTIAERYLHARGVGHVAVAPSLRFSPALWHREAGQSFPAIVAGIQDVHGAFRGAHRIWLAPDGSDKANVDPVKKSLGSTAGGAVRLDGAEASGGPLLVGEGIESTAAAMVLFDLPGWAGIATSGLTAIELPEHVIDVVIAADRDAGGLQAAAALARRLEAEGRDVEIRLPRKGDFNDVLREIRQ